MAILDIIKYPDPRLHMVADEVADINQDTRQLVADMAQTMYEAPGIGLAAPQVDRLLRVIVVDISEDRNDLRAFINPEIIEKDGTKECEEGCLSVPGIYASIQRAERIKVRALNTDGKVFELEADGLLGVCIQHEIDHLDGKVFVDYLSRIKRDRIVKKLKKGTRT
ncbi:MAG: peptide deformylase [Gammaproteobacteria bacterium]|nr:MAG: peptide deformylase [Gammaproteobacteria bacterium]